MREHPQMVALTRPARCGASRIVSPLVAPLMAAAVLAVSPAAALADGPPPPAADAMAQPHDSARTSRRPASSRTAASDGIHAAAARVSTPRGPTGRSTPRAPLDLRAPPINHILTRSQVSELTAEHDTDPTEDVMVESPRYLTPVPVGQLRAIPWAFMHPLEAWRIFAPITSE